MDLCPVDELSDEELVALWKEGKLSALCPACDEGLSEDGDIAP